MGTFFYQFHDIGLVLSVSEDREFIIRAWPVITFYGALPVKTVARWAVSSALTEGGIQCSHDECSCSAQLLDGRNCSARLGWAGLGWARGPTFHKHNKFASSPPPAQLPAPARWPVSSSKSPEVNEFSVLLKHNDHMTLPCSHHSLYYISFGTGKRCPVNRDATARLVTTLAPPVCRWSRWCSSCPLPWPGHHHSNSPAPALPLSTAQPTSPLLLYHKLRR